MAMTCCRVSLMVIAISVAVQSPVFPDIGVDFFAAQLSLGVEPVIVHPLPMTACQTPISPRIRHPKSVLRGKAHTAHLYGGAVRVVAAGCRCRFPRVGREGIKGD
jgi:hypothetical protein